MKTLKMYFFLSAILFAGVSCENRNLEPDPAPQQETAEFTKEKIAQMMSALPIGKEHLDEVHQAVSSSSGNGYDEEYTMNNLLNSPGSGVGQTKASGVSGTPLRDLITSYLCNNYGTKAGATDVTRYLNELMESDYQIYWPYSEDWDGESYPIITFDPGYGAETNYGYRISYTSKGTKVVDSVLVDETVARNHPVWVINTNDDGSFTPMEMIRRNQESEKETKASSSRNLLVKDFTMLRNYDSWFGGASEFFIKCGYMTCPSYSEEELQNYYPMVTDMMISVKRRDVGKAIPLDALLVTGLTEYMDDLAFLITEDDGGTRTSWKCSATVKMKSKSYGFDIQLPYNEKDDIVWRGTLAADYFREQSPIQGRFGDVKVTFALR